MNTETATANIFSTLTDVMVEHMMQMQFGSQAAVRDSQGNLRELTEAEIEFSVALRAEAVRRGLR